MTGGPLGVVVVNYGSSALLAANLAPLAAAGPSVRIVVVDNLSTTAERVAITRLARTAGWDLVTLPDNRGFGAGVNAGLRAAQDAGCTAFLLLNPDACVTAAVAEELRRHVVREPMALVSPRVLASDGTVFFAGSRLLLDTGRIRGRGAGEVRGPVTEWISGACVALSAQLLRRIGPLDESYFLYWEDVELSWRVQQAGGRVVVREDLTAVHDAGGTQGSPGRGKSALYYRYNCANRLRFAAAHLPRGRVLRWMLATPAVSWEVLLRGGRRQLLRRPEVLVAAVAGSWVGLRLAAPALLRPPAAPNSVLVAHPGAELYGSDRMLLESVAGLVDEGCRVTVALPSSGPLVAELRARGAEVVVCRMPVLRKAAVTPRGLAALAADAVRGLRPAWRLVRERGSAGVYVSTVTVPLWVLLGRLARRRVVLHVHEAESGAPAPVRRLLALPALAASEVLVNSRYSRDVLVGAAAPAAARTVVVDNGVAGPALVPHPPRAVLEGSVRLVFVGRLSPRKGPQVAVAALAELARRGVDARLVLAGSVFPGYEWFEAALHRQVAEAGLTDRVSFLGFVPDVWQTLDAADVVLVPSVQPEPFGNAAVEGVLAARPVVVSTAGGLPEAVAEAASAQMVPPGDAVAWADAVARVVADWPAVAARAAADAAEARRRYAPERYRAEVARRVRTNRAGGPR